MKTVLYIYLLLLATSVYSILPEEEEEVIDLITKDDKEILPKYNDENYFYVPIFHSNDIHGSFFPKKIVLPNNEEYSVGGLEYMGKYFKIMEKDWKERLLYFDAGDQFQGGLEGSFNINNSNIMMDYFNALHINKSVLGNHEFDFGLDFLSHYMNSSKFDWIIDNIKNKTSNRIYFIIW